MNSKAESPRSFALAGNPNSGKTTLFNRLTGLRQKVGNYPGVTVERKMGSLTVEGMDLSLIDLPGTYSLSPKSEEERVAAGVIAGTQEDTPPLQGVVCVVDATNLERSLYLVLQVMEARVPMVLALNMMDELAARGGSLDLPKLSRILGLKVFPISARTGDGVEALLHHLAGWARKPPPPARRVAPILESVARSTARQNQAGRIHASVMRNRVSAHALTDAIDRWVLHPVAGPLIFLAVVLFVFQSIFSGARPVMDGMSWLITGLGHFVQGALPDVMLRSFLVDGVISGVGAVIVFLPQILVLFFFVALLEHTGYMARAAMVMDRLMSGVGLQGKSFLPLVSSFACAVPGIMATRTIENRRDRIATLFIAPFMTCSARLPVYALLIGAFVPDRFFFHGLLGWKALTLLGLYVVGFAAAMLTAALLKSTILKSDRMPFVMEVPPYRAPSMKTILLLMWDRSRTFLRRAGTIILGVNLILWFLVSFPQPEAKASIRDSYAGKVGVFIEPAIKPLGFDWKIGVGLLSAQAAREVIVSTLATIYRVEEDDHSQGLVSVLQKEMTPLVALSLMMFFAFSLQCTSTLAVIRRETGGWRWPIVMFLYMNTLGYLSSLVIFQGGKALGLG